MSIVIKLVKNDDLHIMCGSNHVHNSLHSKIEHILVFAELQSFGVDKDSNHKITHYRIMEVKVRDCMHNVVWIG